MILLDTNVLGRMTHAADPHNMPQREKGDKSNFWGAQMTSNWTYPPISPFLSQVIGLIPFFLPGQKPPRLKGRREVSRTREKV